ncbi:MAG: hypothetical protein BroJett040_06110 [Oligoflexia bacterium]|nr:MAG: hypothetical protein BroJett040_06110 [Oligoflexia bacterium]
MKAIHVEDLKKRTIQIHEPFAEFLMADQDEYQFTISLLDVVRFAGHACPSMVGAFLISQRAIRELFPETNICIRGQVAIEIPSSTTQGATGPISNVFSMIFGSWEKSGFGGLQGHFVRRGLLSYESPNVPPGVYRFRNLQTGKHVDISYDPSKATVPAEANQLPFQKMWRYKIAAILKNPDQFVRVV